MSQNVFIGSSSEARDIVDRLANRLRSKHYNPVPWWKVFKIGDVTIDVLAQLADDVDAAVLVWNADDQSWYRGSVSDVTRDNCILEYGLFVSKLGRARTGVLAKRGIRLPSDIAGLTVKFYDVETLDAAIDELAAQIESATRPSSRSIVPVYTDESVWRKAIGNEKIPLTWASRSLYIRDEGANYWRRIAGNPSYPLYAVGDAYGLSQLHLDALGKLTSEDLNSLNQIVSFGPGDGRFEESIHAQFSSQGSLLEWIPVDISQGLLNFVVYSLQRRIPIDRAIVGDFEENLNFIFQSIHPTDNPVPRLPVIVTMVGGTFGNLDTSQQNFMASLKGQMNEGDFFLCDFPLKGSEWTTENDPRAIVGGYDEDSLVFLFQGLAARLQKQTYEVKQRDRLLIDINHDSPIPGTDVISVKDAETGYEMTKFQRYEWSEVRAWFAKQAGMQLIYAAQTKRQEKAEQDIRRMGVVLLKRT